MAHFLKQTTQSCSGVKQEPDKEVLLNSCSSKTFKSAALILGCDLPAWLCRRWTLTGTATAVTRMSSLFVWTDGDVEDYCGGEELGPEVFSMHMGFRSNASRAVRPTRWE